ncbi:MAG: three-Cys-motif partner protein TcmP [Dissulfurispiraceae bacterium]|jgi:three-Cys-motif partner protein|nr:three-Cys-motif partner protein TcmP [Dissulfurispiraceae bacterium]
MHLLSYGGLRQWRVRVFFMYYINCNKKEMDKTKIIKEGFDFFFWEYESQTKIKHFIFEEYFDKWVKILGQRNTLNYFDCYAGSGAYTENDQIHFGSPIRAAEIIEKNRDRLNRQVNIVLIEQDKANIDNIKKIFEYKKLKTIPIVINGDFDKTINDILDSHQVILSPTFFFIDPFGFTIKYETLKRIMSIPKSEILMNFMFTQINRFLIDNLETTLNELFGCEDWKLLRNKTGYEREQSIVGLFRSQLKKLAQHVFYYRMSFPEKNRTYYYLFHLTSHPLGCSVMKSAFAKFNYGKVEYMGPKHRNQTLFDLTEIQTNEIKKYLLSIYKGKIKTYDDIIKEIIDEVPYLEGKIRNTIKDLENKGIVKVKRVDSKTVRGLQGKDIVSFL